MSSRATRLEMSRIPQPTRLRHPPSSPSPSTASTRKSFLSPKTIWSPSSKRTTPTVAKHQLQDMGVVPGSPKVVKRGTIRPPNTIGKGKTSTINRNYGGAGTANSNSNTITPEIGSPMSNLAVVDSTIPSSPSPSRIPASQRYSLVYQPSSRMNGTPSTSRIPLPQSRSTLKSPQPHLRSGIPIPKPKFPTLVNNSCHSPAISICATVATVSPQSSPIPEYKHESESGPVSKPVFVPVMTMDRRGNLSAHESIYSSASAMALSRYRASLPNNNMEMEERPSVDGQGHDLSRISSTTSYSSASSLARHRLSQARSQCQVQAQAQSMSGTTSISSESEQALIWQPDPESTGFDPAENLWKEIEARLNRRSASVEGGRDERGQWVLTSRQKERRQAQAHDQEGILLSSSSPRHLIDGMIPIASTEMRKEESEFTISAYFDPDLSTPLVNSNTFNGTADLGSGTGMRIGREMGIRTGSDMGMEGTAIFDMSAPLVISTSQTGHENENGDRDRDGDGDGEGSVGKTPANTPLIHHETIQRVQRVRKSTSTLGIQSVGMGSRRSGSGSRSSRFKLNADIAHSEIGSLMRSRSDSSSAVVDLDPSLRTSTPTVPSPPQTQIRAQTQTLISDYKDQRQSDEHGHSESMSPSPSHASFQSRSELGYHRLAGDFDIGMTRLDSHVQAALEELSDYRSIYPTTATMAVAGDRTPLAGDKGVCGSTGAGGRYSDQQNQHHHQQYRYEAEDEDEEANTIPDAEDDESTPMPFPNTVRISPTVPDSSDNDKYPLETFGQMRKNERFDDVGLGMGMELRLDSIYSLSVVAPRLRIPIPFPAPVPGRVSSPLSMPGIDLDLTSPTSISNPISTSSPRSVTRSFSSDSSNSPRPLSIDTSFSISSESEGDRSIYKTHDIQDEVQVYSPLLSHNSHLASENHVVEQKVEGGQEEQVEQEEEEEMLTITDLDTGHRVDLSIKRLDELELWRL